MDIQWLRVLVNLDELGTLRAVAQAMGYSTSAVSQHLARLQIELGQELVAPVGRKLILTPAGHAFLPHARGIIGELEAGRGKISDSGPVEGSLRVAGYATSIVRHIAPAVARLYVRHPHLRVQMTELEPSSIHEMIRQDAIDVGVIYTHSLISARAAERPFATSPLLLAVPGDDSRSAAEIIADSRTCWIGDSRASDDDDIIRHITAEFGVSPLILHHIDSLPLVAQLVADGHGVGLTAADAERHPEVRYIDLDGRAGVRNSFTVTRPGREKWGGIAALIEELGVSR